MESRIFGRGGNIGIIVVRAGEGGKGREGEEGR